MNMMTGLGQIYRAFSPLLLVGFLSMSLGGCVETVPDELVEAIESIDRDLVTLRAADVRRKYRPLALGRQ
jgi:hypothetical protein